MLSEDLNCERSNPVPVEDFAPSPELYQAYLQAWYTQESAAASSATNKENNPVPDDQFLSYPEVAPLQGSSDITKSNGTTERRRSIPIVINDVGRIRNGIIATRAA